MTPEVFHTTSAAYTNLKADLLSQILARQANSAQQPGCSIRLGDFSGETPSGWCWSLQQRFHPVPGHTTKPPSLLLINTAIPAHS